MLASPAVVTTVTDAGLPSGMEAGVGDVGVFDIPSDCRHDLGLGQMGLPVSAITLTRMGFMNDI
jgi:hypothetical protein